MQVNQGGCDKIIIQEEIEIEIEMNEYLANFVNLLLMVFFN